MVRDMLNEGIINKPLFFIYHFREKEGRYIEIFYWLQGPQCHHCQRQFSYTYCVSDELFGAKFFSKLDLRLGHHQILVKDEDRHKTTFKTYQMSLWMACYAIWIV